jgi:hypothetical protein
MIIMKELLTLQRNLTSEFFIMVSFSSAFKILCDLQMFGLYIPEIHSSVYLWFIVLCTSAQCMKHQICFLLMNWGNFLWLGSCLSIVLEFY